MLSTGRLASAGFGRVCLSELIYEGEGGTMYILIAMLLRCGFTIPN